MAVTTDDALGHVVSARTIESAAIVLRDQGMPMDELRVVLTSADREVVRHHRELHLERLEEWLVAQRRSLASAERDLLQAAGCLPASDPPTRNDEDHATVPTQR